MMAFFVSKRKSYRPRHKGFTVISMKSTISSPLGIVSVLIAILCVLCLPAAASDQTVIPNSTSIAPQYNGPADPAEVEAFLDSVMPANLA
ncbi:MAG: hypothetical protein WC015_08685, partial [Methanoregula sp.]